MPLHNDGDCTLTELISSLLDRIPKLLSFKSKWSSIRVKLADLNTHLSEIAASSSSSSSSSNQLALDLLLSARETLHDAASVAARCEGPDLSDGKLKTQSDVDSITARLDRHAKDAELLIRSGLLNEIISVSSKKEAAAQAFAAGVLRNLASFGEIKENFVEENAVFVLVSLGSSGTALARENALGCLASLASRDEDMMMLIVREGGIKCLKSFWDSVSDAKSLEVGVVLLKNLALCPIVRDVVTSEGFIPRLVPVLSCGVLGVRIAAAEAVSSLAFSSKSRKEIGESGCIGALIDMLDGKAMEEKEAASKALSTLLVCTSNRKIFKKSDKGVLSLVRLLDPKIAKLDKRYTVSALELLVTSKKCRKQVVAADACLHLQKLVEMDVEGAKKLAENLARSKIWGVFARP
ncbi:hypothetical protein F2Q69_00019907 [Brassica cretica]|uniref:DUF7032 domain-containing protein n=1 Tax=Brassica cretica TaxID=69181 RepID=A0A8S9QKS4_BRACR|nr:hypothetical protein F2Q69_00019907 [Brassica cretica]